MFEVDRYLNIQKEGIIVYLKKKKFFELVQYLKKNNGMKNEIERTFEVIHIEFLQRNKKKK